MIILSGEKITDEDVLGNVVNAENKQLSASVFKQFQKFQDYKDYAERVFIEYKLETNNWIFLSINFCFKLLIIQSNLEGKGDLFQE